MNRCTAGERRSCQSTVSMPVASLMDGVWYGGVGNAGVKPTVTQKNADGCSKFMFTDMKAMLMEKTATVQILEFERPETKFRFG